MKLDHKVLVVDDNFDLAEALALQLVQLGHAAVAAGSVEQALQTLDEDPTIEVVVSDVRMPHVDGLDFRRVLRYRFPKMPVILMTGRAVADDELSPSADVVVLQKPFPVEDLIAALAQIE